jgi:hypothetical protein
VAVLTTSDSLIERVCRSCLRSQLDWLMPTLTLMGSR